MGNKNSTKKNLELSENDVSLFAIRNELTNTKQVSFKDFLQNDNWVISSISKNKSGVFWSTVLLFLTTFTGAALMFISGYLISRSAQKPENILLIYVPIVLTRAFGIARPVFRYVQRLVSHNWVLKSVSISRRKLYESVESTSGNIKGKFQTGKILGILSNDLNQLQNFYLRTLFPIGSGIILYLGSIVATAAFNLYLFVFWMIILSIILILLPIFSIKYSRNKLYKQKKLQSDLYIKSTDSILGLQEWILANRKEELLNNSKDNFEKLTNIKNKLAKFGWYRDLSIQILVMILVMLILLWSNFALKTDSLVNYIAAFSLMIFPLADIFLGLNQGYSEIPNYEDSIQRLNDLPKTVSFENEDSKEISDIADDITISLENISFAYGEKLIIDDISYVLTPGKKVAIIGKSGTGKTTLLKLLTNDLQVNSGQIKYNNKSYNSLVKNQISILDQDTHLFNTSIANNIRLGNLEANDEDILYAAKQAGLEDLINELPNGINTSIKEAGSRFSGGEQQRIALARTLISNASIVILDEPTVALDPKTELQVLRTIFETLQDKTIIWVTHHLLGVEMVDEVIMLDQGKIKLSGSPEYLLNNSEYFKNLLSLDKF